MEKITYYFIRSWDDKLKKPKGLLRRRIVDGVVHEEEFTRELRWEPTEFFKLYRLGHDDDQYEEITEEEAQAFIARTEEKFRQHPELRDVVKFYRSPSEADRSDSSKEATD
ncbi:MAG: hypothetical protein GEV03_07650 [Streptosporangiales bacterium]|nr:hypothetical protein [Streptosporangiales bacterium]